MTDASDLERWANQAKAALLTVDADPEVVEHDPLTLTTDLLAALMHTYGDEFVEQAWLNAAWHVGEERAELKELMS